MTTILLIEDSPGERRIFLEALEGRSCTLLQASSSKVALEVLEANRCVNLIFLDHGLPGMDGIEFMQQLKSRPRWNAIPVIMFSGSDNPKDVEDAYQFGVCCFVKKPMQLDAYLHAINACLDCWCSIAQLPSMYYET
jgi:CheY-like chemotaxis protein